MKKAIGLTGGIASGKSALAAYLADLGAEVVDADNLAKKAMKKGSSIYRQVVEVFGQRILDEKKAINREVLAEIVFADKERLATLNSLVHPHVISLISKKIAEFKNNRLNNKQILVVEVPLLIETNMVSLFDKIVVVTATPEQQLSRLLKSGYRPSQAVSRIHSQVSDLERFRRADFIIINKLSLDNLKTQSRTLYAKLTGTKEVKK